MKLNSISKNRLKKSKNLLAFSAGVDSTALFFILQEHYIDFDIAIVDYALREQSKDEIRYAEELAKTYNKKIFKAVAKITEGSFEKKARDFRYKFFEEIIQTEHYNVLLTAHQLGDKLEWFLMQLTKGAGIEELYGMDEIESRGDYQLIRPLLGYSKDELIEYLETNQHKYFIDTSNYEHKYKRNIFRDLFANPLIKDYKNGIKNSFEYIKKDIDSLPKAKIVYQKRDYYIIQNLSEDNLNIRNIDKIVKKLGFLLTKKAKDEILTTKDCVVSHKIAIVFQDDKIHIAPFVKSKMDKEFKENMRMEKVPPKIRGYIYEQFNSKT